MTWHRRFFFLLLVLLPTQLGYHFWPQWAMVLGRRVDYLAPTVYLTDILFFATLFFWLLESINRIRNYELGITGKAKKRVPLCSIIIHNSKFILPLLMFVGINIFLAENRNVALYKWLKTGEFLLLGWYIVRTKPGFSLIAFPLSLGVFYSSLLAIAQFILQHSIGGSLWWLGERTFDADTPGIARIVLHWSLGFGYWDFGLKLRPYATFPHPNVLGGFLAALLPLLLIRPIRPILPIRPINETMLKIFQWTTIVLGMVALVLTFSRSAITVGGVAIALAIARSTNYELRMRKSIRFVVISFVGIVIVFLTSYFMIHNSTDESVVVRQQLNAAAVKLWVTSPLFGVGLGNFLVRLPETLPSRTIYFLQPVHNIYLLLLSEIGIVGIGIIVLWVVWLLKYELRIRNYDKRNNKELFIIRTSVFIIFILGLLDHYPLTLQQGQLLLTVLAAESLAWIH